MASPTAPALCTIISKNYLAFARTLVDSFLRHHPESKAYVLLVDRIEGAFDPSAERFTVVEVEALDIPDRASFFFKYDILELNTAVKPFWIRHLFDRYGEDRVIYLDPDILVTSPLGEVVDRLAERSLVLIPHLAGPVRPEQGRYEKKFLLSGTYNLGFIGVRDTPEARSFLEWWAARLHHLCLNSAREGLFVDQRWLDLARGFFDDVAVVRHPGYNVAYWNLHERTLSKRGADYLVNGEPLSFFHFSGFMPGLKSRISKTQVMSKTADVPHLRELFEEYDREITRHGRHDTEKLGYAFGRFENGEPITGPMRRAYYSRALSGRFGDPFRTGTGSFYRWWQERERRRSLSSRVFRRAARIKLLRYARFLYNRYQIISR